MISTYMIEFSTLDFANFTLTVTTTIMAFLIALKKIMELEKEPAAISLSFAMGMISIWRMNDVIHYLSLKSSYINSPPILDYFSIVSYFFGAPFFYFYINYNISNQKEIFKKAWNHLIIPLLLTISFFSSVLFIRLISGNYFTKEINAEIHGRMGAVLYLIYTMGLLTKLISFQYRNQKLEFPIFLLNISTIVLIIGAIISYFFDNSLLVSIFLLTLLSLVFIFSDFYKSSILIVQDVSDREKYLKSHIKDLDVEKVMDRINHLMVEEKIYRDDQISLSSFANRINLSPHQISELINSKLGISYSTFITNFRIAEAKTMLEEDSNASIIAVAYHVGYNSLSSFYAAFKKITGLSPGNYQRLINRNE